jgi:hypothetical protein
MKKFTLLNLFTIILAIFVMFFTIPAFAVEIPELLDNKNGNIQGAIGNGNVGFQSNGSIHDNVINTGASTTDIDVDVDFDIHDNNVQLGEQEGRNNTAINGDNSGIIIQAGGRQGEGECVEEGGGNNITAVVDNSIVTVEAAETKRDHHTGTPVTFASLGTYAESRFAGANFQTVEMMTMFKDTFSYEGALEVYGKPFGKGMCETVGKSYNGRHEDDPSAEIKVFTMKDKVVPDSIESIGFLTIIGREGKGATSFIVMQKAILSAAIMQGDAILVTKEGAETVTKSSGWGIGFNTSGSVINDMDNRGRSAAASGGTGWSTGKGKLEVLPWIVVQVLKFK